MSLILSNVEIINRTEIHSFIVTLNKLETSKRLNSANFRCESWTLQEAKGSGPTSAPAPLMDWTSSSSHLVKLALVVSGTAGSDLPVAPRSPRTSQGPLVSVGAAKSLHAALLTDAQLVSDGHSSLVLNGARVQMKAGGAFYVQAKFMVKSFSPELDN